MKLSFAFLYTLFLAFAAHADIQPYPAPIWCKGDFRCAGMTYPKGKVSANSSYWSDQDCLNDLKAQVSPQCSGGSAQLLNVQIINKNDGSTVSSCSERNFYFPWAAISGSEGGFGSVEGQTEAGAKYAAYSQCREHSVNSCRRTVSTPKNGCVGYYFSDYYRVDYFYTGCSEFEVRQKAQLGCAGVACREVNLRCAH